MNPTINSVSGRENIMEGWSKPFKREGITHLGFA
jgi:hypothetical protein